MYLGLEGRQYGIKAIVTQLNADGVQFRGKPFAISNVHRMLTQETYAGTHWFNVKDTKTGKLRPRSEWVAMSVPPIIERGIFERVQALLADRNPRKTAPRVVSGPTLLTGLATCASCGSGMTLRTGKFNQYRYYACAGRAQKGPTRCDGCSIQMARLDDLVLEQLADRIFEPTRLADLLQPYLDGSAQAEQERRHRQGRLKAELTQTDGAIQKLLDMVEKGLIDLDDPALVERLQRHRSNRTRLNQEIAAAGQLTTGPLTITARKLERLSSQMRELLRAGPVEFRRAYLRMFVHRVVVSRREVRIAGPKSALAKAVASPDVPLPGPEVLSFVREWRPRRTPSSVSGCLMLTQSVRKSHDILCDLKAYQLMLCQAGAR
jgi:hypothetical protein